MLVLASDWERRILVGRWQKEEEAGKIMPDGYYGGLFDGEGTLGLLRLQRNLHNRYSLAAQIRMVNREVLQSFQRRFGGSINFHSEQVNRDKGKRVRDNWIWVANGSKMKFLQTILPYTIEKREQVQLALDYIQEFGEGSLTNIDRKKGWIRRTTEQKQRQQWYYEEFRRLKGRLS